jgi:Icc-related predicted phosphoesterase
MIRVLTVTDLHQSRRHYQSLVAAVHEHRPQVVASVGDVLDFFGVSPGQQCGVAEWAGLLAKLPVEHLIFVRGNHEDANWTEFVAAWPQAQRKLVGLYGTSYTVGPLVIVGFPCLMGAEFTWCAHLAAGSNEMELAPARCRAELPGNHKLWLPQLLRKTGPAGRTFWLMHEPPTWFPLATPQTSNPEWTRAVEDFQPLLTISGHDHQTPGQSGKWHAKLGGSTCVNVGQADVELHYCVVDCEFRRSQPSLPTKIKVRSFPWLQQFEIVG